MNKINEIEIKFEEFRQKQKEKHDELLTSSIGRTINHKYSHEHLIPFFPYEYEVFGLEKGTEINEPNEIDKDIERNSFDKENRLIMTERVLSGNRVTSRDFFSYNNEFIERISFQKIGSYRLKSISRYYQGDEKYFFNVGNKGRSCWTFNYRSNILCDIDISEQEKDSENIQSRRVFFRYKDKSLVEISNVYKNGTSQVVYSRK